MSLKFRGDYGKLKKSVSRAGLVGRWKELSNGQRQFVTDDNGILNWAPSTGRVWFQGDKGAAEKLECAFIAVASARGRIESESKSAQLNPDEENGVLKKLLADALLDNAKLKRQLAG